MPLRYLIPLALGAVLTALPLSEQAFAGDINSEPTVVQDPHFGEVLFYFYQEDYFPAIVRLMAAREKDRLGEHRDEAELLLGGLYLSYGHHLRAAEIFEQLLADNVNPDVRDRTWFFLARIWRQRGYHEKALEALANIEDPLPDSMEAERRMLTAQLLIDAGEHGRAIHLLADWKGRTEWASYARYNLAVAMVRDGQVNNGTQILDDLGRMQPHNEELRSLRDKANLALGYAYLQSNIPLAAKKPLQRVRLEGPFSNKALLGIGWADAELEDYSRAIVPWMALKDRNLLDPAVQESMLAIPYAMAKLDSISQAADHYLNAIEAFDEEGRRLDSMIGLLESGEVFDTLLRGGAENTTGWSWRLDALPEGPESQYLFQLLSSDEFQESLKNYRDLAYLVENLDEWQGSIDVFRSMLDTRQLAYQQRLPKVEASLAAADIDGMVARKLEFDAQLKSIEANSDYLALASRTEFDLWEEITTIEQSRAANAEIPEAQEVRDKLRLLKGTLQWSLEQDFKSRLAGLKREARVTGEALVETQRARRQIDETMREEPMLFASFDSRVAGLGPRIAATRTRLYDAMGRQRAFLQNTAIDELRAQKQRLGIYSVQARFALAAIYDLSATTLGATSE